MRKLKLAILKNEVEDDHRLWIKACEEMNESIEWFVVDITKADWLERMLKNPVDGLLAIPSGWKPSFRTLYDERVRILHTVCGIPVYPTFEEILIYENKKYLSYWLVANNIPHPRTWVFYYKNESLEFIRNAIFPLVAKTYIGSGGSGVTFLYTKEEAEKYIFKVFSDTGIVRKAGPKWRRKGFASRVFSMLSRPGEISMKLWKYRHVKSESQKDFVIFQEYIPHTFEWRCVRIGDSFFAHKKIVLNEKASGSLLKGYESPPLSLLDFVKKVTDLRSFVSQAVDIFEAGNGNYLVNEMQCIFGQSDPHQMIINGQPGRYIFQNNQWVFEPGEFNRLECFLLRLENFSDILERKIKT